MVNLVITPTPDSFGDVTVGQSSAPHTFTITNRGPAMVQSPSIFNPSPSVFSVSADQCSNVMLAQNASCTFQVTAHPTAVGYAAAEVGTFVYSGLLVRGVP